MNNDWIGIVSGLPRSGTSMMMQMLRAGGMDLLTDGVRSADEDNPKGYYEYELVKNLPSDTVWLTDARGKFVKIVSSLLEYLPDEYQYRTIFMLRDLREIVASQNGMLISRGEQLEVSSDHEIQSDFELHLNGVRKWLADHPNFNTLYVAHREVMERPDDAVDRIIPFLGADRNREAMIATIDRSLYRKQV